MKKSIIYKYIPLLFLGILLVSPNVSAAHSQGLQWAYGVGVQYDYIEDNYTEDDGETSTIQHSKSIVGLEYPEIDDPLTNESAIPIGSFAGLLDNGSLSEINPIGLYVAVPIGNWELLGEVVESYHAIFDDDVEITETSDEWGYTFVLIDNEIMLNTVEMTYSKVDGMLTELVQIYDYRNQDRYMKITIYQGELPSEDSTLFYGILLVTAALVAIAVVIVLSKRFR